MAVEILQGDALDAQKLVQLLERVRARIIVCETKLPSLSASRRDLDSVDLYLVTSLRQARLELAECIDFAKAIEENLMAVTIKAARETIQGRAP